MNRYGITRRGALALGGSAALASGFAGGAWAEPGKRFVTANNSPYDTLDPHVVFDIGRIATRLNMYDCLVRWTDNPPKLQMWLADKIDIAPDGITYTVAMKSGAKFHDGSAITADDVVFSMERILAMKKGAYGLFKGVIDPGKTKALDAHTVQFTLNQPFAVFTSILSELWVVNSKLLREHDKTGDLGADWLTRNEAGSGGFKLRRYDPAIGFQADRFDDHFAGFGRSNISSMEFRVVLETASRALGLQKGEFNTTDGYLPQDQIKRLRMVDSVQILEAESLRTMYHHSQQPAAADRREPAQGAVLRVRLRRVHQQHPGRFGGAQCRHHSRQSVGRTEGPGRLQLRPGEGEGASGDGQGADAPAGNRRAGRLRPERGRGATVAGRGCEDRYRDQTGIRTMAGDLGKIRRSRQDARPGAAMAQRLLRRSAQLDRRDLQQPQHRRREFEFLQECEVR
jgi:hypothetical protein